MYPTYQRVFLASPISESNSYILRNFVDNHWVEVSVTELAVPILVFVPSLLEDLSLQYNLPKNRTARPRHIYRAGFNGIRRWRLDVDSLGCTANNLTYIQYLDGRQCNSE